MKIMVKKPTQQELDQMQVTDWAIWESERSTFDWHYEEKETCYVLEGKVTVKTDTEEVSFGKGDLVVFPAGLSCVWDVQEKVRKHYKFG